MYNLKQHYSCHWLIIPIFNFKFKNIPKNSWPNIITITIWIVSNSRANVPIPISVSNTVYLHSIGGDARWTPILNHLNLLEAEIYSCSRVLLLLHAAHQVGEEGVVWLEGTQRQRQELPGSQSLRKSVASVFMKEVQDDHEEYYQQHDTYYTV